MQHVAPVAQARGRAEELTIEPGQVLAAPVAQLDACAGTVSATLTGTISQPHSG